MTTSPTSYLQILAKDEAIAFVASLQKVKIHLSHELVWMSQQVQQKTAQLQGIEPLLAEAEALGLVNVVAESTVEPTVIVQPTVIVAPTAAPAPATAAAIAESIATNGSGLVNLPVVAAPASLDPAGNSDAALATSTSSKTSHETSLPPAKASTRGKRGSQPAATKKNSAAPAPKAKPTASTKVSQPARESTQPFVRSQFQDQSITDAIGDILKRSRSALDADAIMTALYEGLSDEAYKRVKNSVTNILSVGRSKGKWKSTGRGLYANNAVGTYLLKTQL